MGKRIPATQITAWSFSRYSTYKQCPLKAKLAYIDKITEPPNDAMARGSRIHDDAEAYIKGKLPKMPIELKKFAKLFRRLKKQYQCIISGMVVEDTWAFTKDWDQTTWNDWIRCWVRIKLDCAEQTDGDTLVIRDWKTGKFREEMNEDYVEQLELYALAAFLIYQHIKTVRPILVYLDLGIEYPPAGDDSLVFTREDLPALKTKWEKRVAPMLADKSFAPRPNNKCHWCFYRAANKANGGGQCKF